MNYFACRQNICTASAARLSDPAPSAAFAYRPPSIVRIIYRKTKKQIMLPAKP
jgi:hypothetical protein